MRELTLEDVRSLPLGSHVYASWGKGPPIKGGFDSEVGRLWTIEQMANGTIRVFAETRPGE